MKPTRALPTRALYTSPFSVTVAEPVEQFAINDRVTHDRFGLGSVIGVEHEIAVLVDFGAEQVRITSPYAKLSKL